MAYILDNAQLHLKKLITLLIVEQSFDIKFLTDIDERSGPSGIDHLNHGLCHNDKALVFSHSLEKFETLYLDGNWSGLCLHQYLHIH